MHYEVSTVDTHKWNQGEIRATIESAINASLHQANALEDSKVVNDLPGMPPDREIEFAIELVPRTEAI